MIQDIAPARLDNAYAPRAPGETDSVLFFDSEGRLYAGLEAGICFPTGRDLPDPRAVYLFSVDESRFFLSFQAPAAALPGFEYRTVRELRDLGSGWKLFAAFTAFHLWRWYADHRYCGRCGAPTGLHETERALRCGRCGQVIYPRINPAVIVGVIKGSSLLITRYRTGYAHNALIAGFTEIGETAEQTVRREVMEETGIRVRNIRYYKSQPWGMAQDLLLGFFCDADGDDEIRMDPKELKYAQWVNRADIVLQPNDLSLTNDMMKCFKNGEPLPEHVPE